MEIFLKEFFILYISGNIIFRKKNNFVRRILHICITVRSFKENDTR